MAGKYDGWYDNWYPKTGNFEVPSYKKYNSIEGIWQLEYVRDKLAKHGLKDPWMRNEIWRYPSWYKFDPVADFNELLFGKKLKGLKYGFFFAASIITCQTIYWRLRYGEKPAHADNLLDWFAEMEYARKHPNQ